LGHVSESSSTTNNNKRRKRRLANEQPNNSSSSSSNNNNNNDDDTPKLKFHLFGDGTEEEEEQLHSSRSLLWLHRTSDALQFLNKKAKKNWFVLGMFIALSLAALFPSFGRNGGQLHAEVLTKIIISFIFFTSGLCLPLRELRNAASLYKLHAFIQVFNLLFAPLVMLLFALLLRLPVFHFEVLLLEGLVVLSCLPTTVGSSVLFTKNAYGNVAAAVFNSTLGNLLGIFVSPLLIFLLNNRAIPFVGTTPTASQYNDVNGVGLETARSGGNLLMETLLVTRELCLTVFLPLLGGQSMRHLVPSWVVTGPPWGTMSSCGILIIVYSVFCDAFNVPTSSIATNHILSIALLVIAYHFILVSLCWISSDISWFGFDGADRVAALYCGTQKTMALGIGLISTIYSREPKEKLIYLLLPLLFYHPTQMLVSGFSTSPLGNWMKEKEKEKEKQARQVNHPLDTS